LDALSIVVGAGNSGTGAGVGGISGGVVADDGGTSSEAVAGDASTGGGGIDEGMGAGSGVIGEGVGTVEITVGGIEGTGDEAKSGWAVDNVVPEDETIAVTTGRGSSLGSGGTVAEIWRSREYEVRIVALNHLPG
jgi:hypothetical protein